MPSFLTAEMAREAIGLYVVEHQKTGPASSAGWACPAKLKSVISNSQCVVQPNGHKREEITEIRNLRLWMKGNHDLGEQAMKRAIAIDSVADLQAKIGKSAVRSITLQDARDWLGNGENTLVLVRTSKTDKRFALARLVGLRENRFLVRLVGDKDQSMLDLEEHCVGVPIGVEMNQLDYNLLEKALAFEVGKRAPDRSDMPVQAVRAEIPQPTSAPSNGKLAAPAQSLIPFPVRAPTNEATDIPREPKPAGKGDWVIVDRKKRAFWAGSTPTANGQWVKEIEGARVYDNSGGVNVAVARMNRAEGDDPEAMSLKQAQFFYDLWYRPSRLAQVEAETKRIAESMPAPVIEESTADVPSLTRRDALAQAIRNRAAAEVMLLEAQSKEALARADWEIERLGEA